MSASLRILLVGALCVCVRVIPRMQILKLKPNLVDADHKRQRWSCYYTYEDMSMDIPLDTASALCTQTHTHKYIHYGALSLRCSINV